VKDTYYTSLYFIDLTQTNITLGTVFINKIDKFFHCRLGRFRVGKFWGLGRFGAWDVLKLGTLGVGTF
jgi:hypothetical protein